MKTVIGFHRPEEINGSFSNWYLSDFVVDGIKYSSMEQYICLLYTSDAADEL